MKEMIISKQHDVNLNKHKYKFNLRAILQMTKTRGYFLMAVENILNPNGRHLKVSFVKLPTDAVYGSLHFAQTL